MLLSAAMTICSGLPLIVRGLGRAWGAEGMNDAGDWPALAAVTATTSVSKPKSVNRTKVRVREDCDDMVRCSFA